MDLPAQKMLFSHAVVRAIAAAARLGCDRPELDPGIDFTICPKDLDPRSLVTRLNVQVKCSAVVRENRRGQFPFELEVPHYDLLRNEIGSASILVLVTVPEDVAEWMQVSDEEILCRRSAYWLSLRGMRAMPNRTKVTVHIPKAQRFTPAALSDIMGRIAAGGYP